MRIQTLSIFLLLQTQRIRRSEANTGDKEPRP